jgi:hypothetical protein
VLLEQTLIGSVKMLIEILGMLSPHASSRAARIQRYVVELSAALSVPNRWQWNLGALVSQLGCAMLPKELLAKVERAEPLSSDERGLYESHPQIAGKLLAAIPRLDDVAAIVTAQYGPLRFADKPDAFADWDLRGMGQLLLRTAVEFDQSITRGLGREAALEAIRSLKLSAPPSLFTALRTVTIARPPAVIREVRLRDLLPGMVLEQDLVSAKGIRLVPAGQEVTRTLIVKLTSIAEGVGVAEPFRVRVIT